MKNLMKISAAVLCAVALAACTANLAGEKNSMQEKNAMTEQKESMNESEHAETMVSLMDTNGKSYQLSDFKGKKVYVKFWASWCSICLAGLEETNALAMHPDEDTVVLSVVSPNHNGEQNEDDFKKWFNTLEYKALPVLLDSDGKLLEEYQVRSYPTSVFIDTEGNVASTRIGHIGTEEIQNTLKEIH